VATSSDPVLKPLFKEYQFDGLVGPTHNYGGLSVGNLASQKHRGKISNPKLAALEGLAKAKFVHDLGVGQALLPPQFRPSLRALRTLGFAGSDEEILSKAASTQSGIFLRLVSSAASMWAANAATVAPSSDTEDGRLHILTANLSSMFHRSIEADQTKKVLKKIFSDAKYFQVHDPLPSAGGHFSDEGAANHLRLHTSKGTVHLFAWGRSAWLPRNTALKMPKKHPARQTLEASEAVARILQIKSAKVLFPKQLPESLDAGAFHSDVLAVSHLNTLLIHERAFEDQIKLLRDLRRLLGEELEVIEARTKELSLNDAVQAYPFNSQILSLDSNKKMVILAPEDSRKNVKTRKFFDRIVSSKKNSIDAVHYLSVRQSMQNGGGPACLRLRVAMTEDERSSIRARVFLSDQIYEPLVRWVEKFYRDRLEADDLEDPKLARESMQALDELTQILELENIYEFQS